MYQGREQKDRLEKLEKNLYSRTEHSHALKREPMSHRENINVASDWEDAREEGGEISYQPRKSGSISSKIMIFSLIFFFMALSFSIYIYYKGVNVFSSNNIEINVLGSVSTAGGEDLPLEIEVKNNNTQSIKEAVLKIEYPDGTRDPKDITLALRHIQEELGEIPANGSVKKKTSAVLFGEENSKKEIKISMEYRVDNSNAIYEKLKKFDILLASAPISIKIDSLSEINSGQEVEFTVDVSSNSPNVLKNMIFKAEYPFGWSFNIATPKAAFDNQVWEIGDLKPGDKKKIKIKGKIEGQDGEERVFRFSSGLQSDKDEKSMEPAFLTVSHSMVIKKPFIGTELILDGNANPIHVSSLGKNIRGDVIWENNLTSQVNDVNIEVKITGKVDESSISASRGFYNSSEDIIFWNSSTLPDLNVLKPGESGRVSFSFSSLPKLGNISLLKNPEILLSVNVKGKRTDNSLVPEEIISTVNKKVRLESDLSLDSKISYYNGPFKNTGPLPPEAEKETTYTVTWTISNTWNDVRDVNVSATLPPYVKWAGVIDPEGDNVSYTPAGGKVLWNVGDVRAGEGIKSQGRQMSFQVSFLPSISQVGNSPIIINQPEIYGIDRFTESEIRNSVGSLNIELIGDTNFRSGNGKVTK